MAIVEDIIRDYMAAHSRLTVVGLGTFLRRDGDEGLLFTEFVMEDDGVLFAIMVKSGVAELEATSMIESFVERVHKSIEVCGSCEIEGVGVLRNTPVGLRFRCASEEVVAPVSEVVDTPAMEEGKAQITEGEKPRIAGASQYQDFFAEGTKSGRRIDMWMLFAAVIIIFAVGLFAYSLVLKWQMGELLLPASLDNMMMKLFGEL